MKKLISFAAATALSCGMVLADIQGSFSATGDAAGVGIAAQNGAIECVQFVGLVATNKTLTIHRAQYDTEMAAAASSTTVTVYCASSNTVDGFTPTTSDFLIIETSSGLLLRQISSVGTYNSTTKVQTYVMTASTTAADGDKVFVADATYALSVPLTTTRLDVDNLFVGYKNKPVYLQLASGAGASSIITGSYRVKK